MHTYVRLKTGKIMVLWSDEPDKEIMHLYELDDINNYEMMEVPFLTEVNYSDVAETDTNLATLTIGCKCGNPEMGFDCTCKFQKENPGNNNIPIYSTKQFYENPLFDDLFDDYLEDELFFDANPSFVTNFSKSEETIYKTAIWEFGDKSLFIQESIGYEGDNSLHCWPRKDLTEFWKVFDNIENYFKDQKPQTLGEILRNCIYSERKED